MTKSSPTVVDVGDEDAWLNLGADADLPASVSQQMMFLDDCAANILQCRDTIFTDNTDMI